MLLRVVPSSLHQAMHGGSSQQGHHHGLTSGLNFHTTCCNAHVANATCLALVQLRWTSRSNDSQLP